VTPHRIGSGGVAHDGRRAPLHLPPQAGGEKEGRRGCDLSPRGAGGAGGGRAAAAVLVGIAAVACVASEPPVALTPYSEPAAEEPLPVHPSEVPCSARRVDDYGLAIAALDCPLTEVATESEARTRLAAELDVALMPGTPRMSDAGPFRSYFEFVVDTGERPLKIRPVFPAALARSGDVATCIARLDLTPDGRTTNICVACAATGGRAAFETAARETIEGWLYPAVGSGQGDGPRRGLWEGVKFEPLPGSAAGAPPPPPRRACGRDVPAEVGRV
jgi:hypothetical protein